MKKTTTTKKRKANKPDVKKFIGIIGGNPKCECHSVKTLDEKCLKRDRTGLFCTRKKGHKGSHVACSLDACCISKWPQTKEEKQLKKTEGEYAARLRPVRDRIISFYGSLEKAAIYNGIGIRTLRRALSKGSNPNHGKKAIKVMLAAGFTFPNKKGAQ